MEETAVASQAVTAIVAQINRAWQNNDFTALPECFAEEAVMLGPGYKVLGRGRSFFVESYREFATTAAIVQYSESAPVVEVFDRVAICAYSWTMTYQRDGGPSTEAGSDQFVMVRSNSKWQVVWRYLCFQPSP